MAERLRRVIEQTPLEHHGERIAITVMYRAKNSGRNRNLAHTDQFPAVVAMSAVG